MAQWTEDHAKKAIEKARTDKEASDDIYREAMEYIFPDRENFTKTAEGQKKAQKNWDSTATVNLMRAANRLSNDFTPQFQSWAEVGLGAAAEKMDEAAFKEATGRSKDEARQQLENTTAVVNAVFNGPGFPTASNELYIDWLIGQGGMSIMPGDDAIMGDPVVFTSMPMSQFYAYEGPNGRHDRWFFWHELRADAVKPQWPDATLTEWIEKEAVKPKPGMAKLCAVVYRDYEIKGPGAKPFRYEVFHLQGRDCKRIVERQSRSGPFVTPRHSKLAGENRGRGPVLFAIPDIKTANKIVELTLRAVAVAVAGVYTATENGITSGPVQIKPYAVIKVRKNAGAADGPSLARLDNPQRIDFGELVLETLHENIKKILGDHSLPPEAGPIRTATEFIQRARELIADQAGGLGRLLSEFIIPAIQRVIDILETKQILPTKGLIIDQFLIEVRMTSPLARGEAMQEVENLVRFIELLKQLGGMELVGVEVNVPEAAKRIADLMDIPMDVRNTEAQRKQAMKGLAQMGAAAAGGDPAAAGEAVDQEAAAAAAAA